MVEGACLENRCTATYRGFESLTHRINASIFAGVSRFVRDPRFARSPLIPPAPPGDGGKDSPARLCRPPSVGLRPPKAFAPGAFRSSHRSSLLPSPFSLLPSPFSLHAPDGASLRASRFPAARGAEGLLRPWQLFFSAARGAEGLLCPWQLLFPAARGAEGLFRPWQLLFPAARGAEGLLRPRQLLFPAARGAEGLLRPRLLFFPAVRGAEGLLRPRQLFFSAVRGAEGIFCPW